MNKIFKVIWSKSKQCYVVVSEIAKNKTGKKKIVVAGIFAALAMVGTMQHAQAVDGPGRREGWPSGGAENGYAKYIGTAFDPKKGLVVGPNMGNNDTTRANGNVATVAIGAHSNATGSSSVAIGGAEVNGAGAVGLGWATAKGDNSVALGGTGSTNANGNNAFAASGGNATGESATAIGSSAIADGRGGVAVGWNAESKVNAVGIGFNAKAKANNTIAIGVEANNDKANAISNNYSSVSIGVATRARAVGSMAMGVSADASGKYSIALGSGNVSGDYTATANYPKATGEKAIAIGYDGQALNINASAVGSEAHAIGKQSAAYGFKSQASEQDATAIGSNAIASAVRTTALGVNAQALGSNSVAIGGGVGGTSTAGFAEELNADGGDINRLNRNINTATTAEGDNAVALGYYANAVNGGVAIGQTSVAATGGVALGQRVLEDTGNKYASAVVIGQDSTAKGTYSVSIGRQTITKGSTSLAMGNGASANGSYSVAMGRKVVADDTSTAIGHHAYASKGGLAIGAQDNDISADRTTASAKGALAIGKNTKASAEDAVAIGTNAQSTLKGAVALGSGSTTATTATKQTSTTVNGIAYNFAGATSDPNMQISVGAAGKERQIKNVASGEVSATSTDAVNGSQLFAVASQIKPIQYFAVNSSVAGNKDNSGATGSDSVAIGPKAKAQAMSSIALGNNATAAGGNSIAIGNTSSATDKQSPISIGYGATANGDFSIAIGGGDNNTNYGATANGVGGTSLGGKTKTTGGNFQTAVGFGATTTAQNASAFGYNATTSVEGGVALGFNSSSITGVNKGYNPNDNRTNKYDGLKNNVLTSTTGAIAVGNGSTVTRQITGVAAGTNDTDAVNVAQLKSVNLAFKGNVGSGDVNLATNDSDKKLTIQGDRTYITTNASGNTLTISANKKDIHVTNGAASADAGVADAKNVAEAINNAVSQNKYKWYLTADNDTGGSRSTIDKEGTVKFSGDSNINVSRNGNTITTSLNKAITVDSVKANKTITVGTNKITLDGNTGAVTGKAFNGDSFTSGNNVLTNTTLQIGSPTGGNNVTITRDGLTAKAGTKTVKFGTNGINAGDQQINNVASAGGVSTNAANYGDVKNAVSGVTLKINDGKSGSKDSTVNLSDQTLVVKGGTGIQTSVIGQTITVKLDNNTENATTKGIGIKGDNGFATLKYLKDGDAIFNVSGDGSLVTTKSTTTGVQVSVNSSKVKDLAVEAVKVSKATNISDNPITVTEKTGTNSKDYAIGIDTTKLSAKTNLAYTANGATAKTVSLAKGLNFVNGTNTVSSVDSDGKVSFDLNQATKDSINKSATAVGRTITLNADSGTGSSQSLSNGNVSFAVSGATGDYISTTMDGSAVKVSTKRATINSDANTGAASVTGADGLATAKNVASAINSAVNGLSQNLNISDGTNNSSVALKNQKLTVTGTGAAKATVNGQTITIDVAEGTLSNNADGTVKADAAGVATTKNVADVINKTISDNQYSWKLSANGEATTATVGKGDTVDFTGDTNITVDRNNKDISVKLNKNLIDMNSISLGNARGETIFLNGRDGSIKAGKAEFKDNVGAGSTITSEQLSFTNGATGANESTTTIALDTVAIQSGPNSSALTSKYLTFSDEDGNNAEGSAKGVVFQNAAGKLVQFTVDEIKAGGNKIQEVAEGTADTDAVNVKQLKDTIGTQSLTYRANTSADTDAKSVKLSKGLDFVNGTSTVASVDEDGKVSFDLNTATKTQINTNTTDIATNKGNIAINTADIATNKGKIATNTANIATNTANIAHTIALADDKGTSTTAKSLKDGSVSFNIKGDNKFISTAASGNDVTLTVNEQAIKDAAKSASSFKVKANTHAEEEVKGGDTIAFNNGDNIEISQTGKTFTIKTAKNITVDSVTAGNTVINTSGLTNGTTAITGTGITTDKVTVGGISIDKTAGINAGGKVISNVASGTVNNNATDDSNAANIGDVKQAVANLSQNLNITDGTNNGTVDIKNQKLNVAGANGVTATVNNQTITVGLDANTVNATTKGIGLTGDTGSTGNKYLKDGDVSFAVTGDGSLVSTSASAAGVKVAVDAAKVKDLAVASVTVSKDTQADNPITVTPTAGTNSKDYAIGIDTTKLAAKTDLTYRANTATDANAKKVSLSKGLDFVDGGSTVATVDNDGKVSFDLNTATKNQINTNTTDIATNKGKIATNTTNIAANTTALARHISLGADTGTASSQSLSTADVAFNVKGATGDFVSTNMNGNTVEISTKRATINSNSTTGEASVTGNDGLATAQNVADAINKAADAAKAGAAWNITTNSSTTDKTAVKGGDTVDLINGDNIEITQDGTDKKKITVATKKDISVDSVTANNKVTVGSGANKITLDGTDGSVTGKAFTGTTFTGTSFTAGNTVINTSGLTNGTTAITGTGVTTDKLTVGGISVDKTDGINAGGKVISNVTSGGTTDSNAANIGDVKQAVANLSQNLNITDGTNNGTIDLKNQKLNVAGANGVTTTVKDQTITVGLDANTINATTKGIGLTGDTGSTGNKYLKDGDVSFAVTGDGSLVSTSATAAGVKVAVNSASITAGADGTITGPTKDGVATAKNVADAINAAKKASKTEITANTGEAANATSGNVTLTSTTAADGHTNYDVKLNDKVTLGTGANAVTVDGTTGAITGKTATIGGVTVNGTANTIGGLSNTTWNGTATTGRAATEDQLKAVADAAGSQTWEITADKKASTSGAQTGTKENAKVGKDDKVSLIAGENLTVDQAGKNFTYSLNADLVKMNSATFEATGGKTTVIKGDSIAQTDGANINTSNATSNTITDGTNTSTITAGKAQIGTVGINGVASKITTGGANAVVVNGADGTVKTGNVTVTGGTTNDITGLSNTTLSATDFATKGRAATEEQLKAATGATTLKFTGDVATNTGSVNLKDDTFGIKGDNKYISTDVNGKNVNLKVSEAEVKKSAVAAVTVSTDTTDANNPLTVTPTTSADGTTKDYKVTIDGTKIANKTNLSYKANDGTAKQVSLADGLNFKNGTLTTASIDDNGVVKYDVNTAAITAGTDGTITGPTTDGVATAKNVADAINAAKKASKTEITANAGEAANATKGNVTLTSTTAADGHTIYDVKLNDKVTLGSGANTVTVDGTAAKVTAGVTTVDGATGTITTGGTNSIKVDGATGTVTGLTNKDWTPGVTKAVTGRAATEDQLQKVADAASSQTWNITADKAGTTGAQTGTKKNATVGKDETVELVAGDNLTINQDERKFTYSLNKDLAGLTSVSVGTGTTETIKLDGTTGKITAKNAAIGGVTIDGDNKHVTGLSNTTWNGTATTGRAATEDQLKAVAETAKTTTDAVNLKFTGDTNTSPGVVNLKDDTFGIVGDGKYVSTDANGKNLTVKVSEAEVKKSAVAAVTVSTDTTDANNPISVTPTTSADGTTKDYKVTIDGTKIANKTNLSYKANDGTAKQVSLADGLNFKNGTLTTASIDDAGVVKYDVNTAAITAGADGTITGPTTDGVATAQNVADAINAAKKASKTEITANTGEAANATTGNVTLTSTTAADGHTIYDVKLNDKVTLGSGANAVTIDGTAGKATIGSSVINGVNNTFTTGGAKAVTLDGATGTITGTTANIGGVTVNGTANTIGGLSNTTWNGTATTGRAATEDQLKAVADAAGSQTWEITADKKASTSGAQTGTKENAKVGKDDKVSLIAGENLTVDQAGKNFTYSLNADLVKMNSATFEATGGKTTVIKGDSIVQTDGTNVNTSNATSNTITDGTNTSTITAGKAQIGTVGIDGVASKITTGGTNAVVVNGADGTVKTGTIIVTGGTTNDITGLSNTTVTGADFATKGRAATEEQLKAATGATTLKFAGDVATNTGSVNLKNDTFGIKGDGKYISTDVNGKNVNLTVSDAEVKKSAVAAVTVSTDTTDANNPLTVTPTTSADGTTKDYKVTIDGTKIANKTNLSYKANDGTAKQVSLADGLNFKNGTLTTASIDDAGVVKYDVNTAAITAGADGTITGPTTDGVATAQNVADAINAAKKASKTEITANTGEAANATTGNVTLTSTTAADGHTIYDVKLNDKVTLGTGANAVTIDGTTGAITGKTATIGGVTVNGTANTIGGLSNTTWNGIATTGRAATEDQLKAVADAAGSQTWEITADKKSGTSGAQTGTKENAKVGKDDKVSLIAGENLTVDQAGKNFTYSLNTDLVKMNSATFEATGGKTTVIKGDSIVQTDGNKTNTATASGNTVANGTKSTETTADGQVIKDGAKSNKSTVDNNVIDDGNGNVNTSNAVSNTITDGTNTSTVTAGKATIGSSVVDGVNNTFTTGGANAVKLDGGVGTVKTGTVTVTGGTTNDITGLSNTTVTAADFATKGRAATEEQLKAVGEQTWQITADKDTATSGAQTGTKKDAKVGKDDKVQLIAGENLTVNQNERDFTYSLNKDLVKMNSATFEATGGKTTVIKGDSIVQTAGTQTNTSTAAGNTVADGTKSTETTAAGQVIKDGTKTNISTVDENTIVDGAKSNKTTVDSNVIDDGNGNVNTSNATSNTITDGTNTSTITAGKAQIGTVGIDGVASKITTGGANAVVINGADGTVKTGTVTVTGGTTNDITGLSNTTVTAADFATKGRAATEEQLKAVGEQTWQITADKDATTSGAQTGTKKDAKVGKDDKVQLIAGENLTVNQNERDFTYSLNKDLVKMNSATFEATGGKTTVIKGDSIVQTDGNKTNTATASGNTVANGTKSTETTADGQVIKDGAKTNTSTVDENTLVDGTKSNKTTVDSNVIDDGNGNVNTSNATSNTITDGTNTSTITAGKATIGSSVVDGVNNTFTTGGANAVKLDGAAGTIKTGTVTVTGGTTNDIVGLSNTTVTAADFATKGRAATEEQLKAVGEQTWQITADKDATTSGAQTGTKKDAKVGKDDKVQLIAGENLTVNQNERDFTYSLNKDLVKMNSATFLGTGTNKTIITGDSITQTAGTQTNTSTAAGNTVVDGTKSTETTAAGQVIKDGTKTNTSTVDENTLVDGTKSNKTTVDSNVIDDGNGNVNTSNATSNTITDGTNTSTITAGKATIGSSIVDGVNNTFTTGGANAVKLDGAAGTIKTGTVTVTGGTTNDIIGLSNTTVTAADFATKGRAATEEQLKAVGEQTWQITADKDATTSGAQTGTKKDAKVGKDDKVQLIAGENLTVNQNERDFTYSLNKDLVKMNSATFEATGGKTTVIKGDSIVQTDGTKVNTSTAGGNTVVDGTKSTATTADGTTVTSANGNTKYAADGVRINTTGKNPVSLTDAGLDNGNNVIKNVASGHVNNDATDNTNAANIADVKKATTTVTANAGEAANATKGNVTLTSTTAADGHTIYDVKLNDKVTLGTGANAVTIDGTSGKATIGSSVIDGVNNTFTTGGANAVKLDGAAGTIKTGTVTVTGGTTNDITGLSNTTVTSADFATKGRAATEEQLKAVGEQTWQITADKDAATSGAQTGTKKDAKVGKNDKVQLIAGENMTVNQNERDFTFTINKDLVKMNSATFLGTGTNKTVITGDSITQTAGTQTNTSTAAGNTVVDGTKSTETTAAGQVIKDGTKTNTSTVDENTLVDGTKSNNTTVDSNVIDDGNGNVNTSNATSNTITDGTNTSTVIAGKATIGSSIVDGINNTFTTGGANAVKLDGAAGTIKTGTVTVTGGITNDITGLSNTTVTAADFATKGRAATEEQLKAVGEQTWQITADKDATTSGAQTGTKKDAKVGKDDKVQLIAGENMTVNQNERDFTFTLNKDLVKMNSATFLGTGTNKTVITGDSITQTAGTQMNTSTAAGNTVVDGAKSTATTADGTTITSANGNTKYAADGVRINTTGKNPVSLTDAGLDNGNNVIKNVASGHVNNDATDNTNAANIADVKKATTTVTANAGEAANATKGNVTLTSTTAADGHTIYDVKLNDKVTLGTGANAVTIDGTAGKATIGSSVIDGVNNTFTTGGANAVKLDGGTGTVKTGTVTVTGGTTNDITGLSNTTVNSADFATKGRAATEEQLKAVGEQTWQITADKDDTTSGAQTGTKKNAKVGKDDKVQLIAGENLTVNQNERDFTYSLNKDLVKMNSATFEATGGKTTVIKGDSIVQTAGTQTNTSTAAGNTVADGTKSTETTAAGQVIKDGTKTNTSTVDENTLVDGTKSNKSTVDSNVIDDGNGNVNTSNATSNTITDGTNASTITAGKATIGTAVIDGVNNAITTGGTNSIKLDGAAGTVTGLTNKTWTPGVTKAVSGRAATEDQLQIVADKVGAGWNVNSGKVTGSTGEANGSAKTNVASGEEVQLQAGNNLIIDQNGKTLAYSLNKNLKDMESATFNATGGKTTVIKGDSIVQTDGANTNTSTATSNTLKNAAGDETKVDAKGATVKDAAGNTTNVASTGATVTNAAGDTTKVEATGTTVTDTSGNKATFTKDGVTITKPGKDTVSLTGNGLDNGNNKIVNVADGTAAKDAVNVSQLNAKTKAATTELTANGGQGANNTTGNIVLTKTTAADGHTIYDNKLNDKITLGAADPTKAITIDGIAGTITAGKDGNAVAIDGTNGTVKAGDGKNAVAIDGVNGSVKVADKITLNGKDGKAGIGTVGIDGKDGIITTGGTNPIAVNGKDGVVTGLTNKAWNPNNITSGRAATEDQIKSAVANAGWNAAVGSEGSGVNSTPTATAEKIKPNETVTFKAGNNMMVSQVGKTISYAVNPELTDMKSATFKDAAGNTTVTNGNGMTITPGSANPNNPNAGPVSLTKDGLHNGNNQIKGVAPGTDPTDAVNVSQLNASNANTSQAINQVAGEVQRVGAHAAAMAALKPIQYDPLEPTQVMAGVGNYRGETAAALGLAHYTNENTMFNIGVSVGGNHNMVNAGVTHKFGYSPEKKNIPDRYKAGPISSVYVMQDEVSSLKKENAEQKYVIADQAARLNSLEAENERQRRELAETKQGLDDLRAAVDKLLASKG